MDKKHNFTAKATKISRQAGHDAFARIDPIKALNFIKNVWPKFGIFQKCTKSFLIYYG